MRYRRDRDYIFYVQSTSVELTHVKYNLTIQCQTYTEEYCRRYMTHVVFIRRENTSLRYFYSLANLRLDDTPITNDIYVYVKYVN